MHGLSRIFVIVSLLAGCGGSDDLTSVVMRIEYSQDSCGNEPVNSAFFEMRGTVAVHIVNAAVDGEILTGQCVVLEPLAFRALNDLPQVLQDNFTLDPIPLDSRVRVQVAVYDAVVPCLVYRPDSGQAIPKFFGFTDVVDISEDVEIINVVMGCL